MLRPIAMNYLSRYGRVIFGLHENDVGHSAPQWSPQKKDMARAARANKMNDEEARGVATESRTSHLIPLPPDSEQDEIRHGNMAMVEWWILAQSNWLLLNCCSEFSQTAAGVGLGPRGVMERFDIIDGGHSNSAFRRDWGKDSCAIVGAADTIEATQCPNFKELTLSS